MELEINMLLLVGCG